MDRADIWMPDTDIMSKLRYRRAMAGFHVTHSLSSEVSIVSRWMLWWRRGTGGTSTTMIARRMKMPPSTSISLRL